MSSGERVAFFVPSLADGGAESVMVNLANGFARDGFPVDLVLPRAAGPHLARVSPEVRIVDLGSQRTLTSLPRLIGYLRSTRPTAMLSTLEYANLIAVWGRGLSRVKTRLVLREANTMSALVQQMNPLFGRLMVTSMKYGYRQADGIAAVSEGVAKDLVDYLALPQGKIRTIYSPLIPDDLATLAAQPTRHPWFESDHPPVILTAGRLEPQKDHKTLLEAFALLQDRVDARLMILGDGTLRLDLVHLARKLGLREKVAFAGFVDNPYPYMARASLFVLSSRSEGLPGALVQAMACGCPVVSTDCPSGPRELLHNGRFGTLTPVADPGYLAAAMSDALAEPPPIPPPSTLEPFTQASALRQYREFMHVEGHTVRTQHGSGAGR